MKIAFLAAIIVSLIGCASTNPFEPVEYEVKKPEYWPTTGFRFSTPEEQGMDSSQLVKMIEYYEKQREKNTEIDIDSIHIVRNGYMVADLYFDPLYPKDHPHIIHSCTKSIMSALVGIALDKGYIESVDQKVVSFFSDKNIESIDPAMERLTLGDLLTMETGLKSRDSFLFAYEGVFAIQKSDDWIEYFLNLPTEAEPGVRFDYSNLSSFMLSAIIMKSTGMDTLDFARENLFEPLGIDDVRWEHNPQGIGIGWARMWLKPHDMTKIGMLYLQKGLWEEKRIISESWIAESLTAQAFPKEYHEVPDENGNKDNEKSKVKWVGYNLFKPFADGYGYQWWLDKNGAYAAIGTGGQFIFVSPLDNLVVAVTSQSAGLGSFFPAKLFFKYILKAVKSDAKLEPDDEAYAVLTNYYEPPEIEYPMVDAQRLPDFTKEISGARYKMDENNWNYDDFSFDFSRQGEVAISYTTRNAIEVSFPAGSGNKLIFSERDDWNYAASSRWVNESTLEINYQQIGFSVPGTWIINFSDDSIEVVEKGVTGEYSYSGVLY